MQPPASIIVATYGRERVLVECLQSVVPCLRDGDEIIMIDQTPFHDPSTQAALARLAENAAFRFVRLETPSLPAARNLGLRHARHPIAIFVDDDVLVTDSDFVSRHVR